MSENYADPGRLVPGRKRAIMAIIINANREGYGTDQIRNTMTVGELIDALSEYDENTPVFIGNDRKDYGWYTYGGITMQDIENTEQEDEENGDY